MGHSMLGIDADIGHLRFWVASGAAALLVLVCALALDWTRTRIIGRIAVVGIGAAFGAILAWAFLAGAWVRDQSAERRNLELRVAQLTAQVLAPGSPLACLDGMAGENVEAACEKTLFAAPANVAAASSLIAARLNLLADVSAYARNGGNLDSILLPLRHSLEADRFGFVAHTLAARDGCTSGRCPALALLREPERVRANLSTQTFDRYVERYLPGWGPPGGVPTAAAAPPTPPTTGALTPTAPPTGAFTLIQPGAGQRKVDADFPSAASIPAVSIMNPEPKGPAGAAADKARKKVGGNPPAQAAATASSSPVPFVEPVWTPGAAPASPQSAPAQPSTAAAPAPQ
jgi:hypothetical protein